MPMTFDDTQTARLLTACGLPDDTTDPETVTLAVEDLAKQHDQSGPADPPEGAPPASALVAAARAAGLEVLDAESVAALRRDAEEGRRLHAAAAQAKVEADVDEAIRLGKIAPSRREHWVTLCANDSGMGAILAGIAPDTAVPMNELGHSLDPVAMASQGDDDAWVV